MSLQIGPYRIENRLVLAPMAGVTDRPFRLLCRQHGAALTPSEMLTAQTKLWHTRKSALRLDYEGEPGPRMIQIAGADPETLAQAARECVVRGAQIVDINMGCPAKKVCNRLAGSALLQDESLVARILDAVVTAVDVPVTLKMRTGWDTNHRNGVGIARRAEQAGVAALSIHGRTRACRFRGHAEYETISAIKKAVRIPVIANGDIDSPEKAAHVLSQTGADGIMIGRAAQGRPWLFKQVDDFLSRGRRNSEPASDRVRDIMLGHLENLYRFYGDDTGVRVARKHLSWYLATCPDATPIRNKIVRVESSREQLKLVEEYFLLRPDRQNVGDNLAA